VVVSLPDGADIWARCGFGWVRRERAVESGVRTVGSGKRAVDSGEIRRVGAEDGMGGSRFVPLRDGG
jgi:hypothetical protein